MDGGCNNITTFFFVFFDPLPKQGFWGSKKFLGTPTIKKIDFLKKPEFCVLSVHGGWSREWPQPPSRCWTSWFNSLNPFPIHIFHLFILHLFCLLGIYFVSLFFEDPVTVFDSKFEVNFPHKIFIITITLIYSASVAHKFLLKYFIIS